MRRPRPAPPRTKPGTSRRPALLVPMRSRNSAPKVTAAIPSGRLTKNTHRQLKSVTRNPPSTGPSAGRHRGGHGEDAGGADTLGRREDPVEHRHADRRHHAAAGALDHPEHDELGHVLRQAAEHRSESEDDDGDEKHPLAAEAVAEPARRGDEDRQAHQIGDDDAVHRGWRNVEVTADRGQGHVDDRDVHDVHEHRRHEHRTDHELLAESGCCHRPALPSAGPRAER